MAGKKSLFVTYLLWLFGGFFGLHHFYLGRNVQGFLWACFGGGYFGAGWVRDFWRIPEYVRDANDDPEYLIALAAKMRRLERPPFSFVRTCGQLIVGNLFGMLVNMAVPDPEDIGVNVLLLADILAPAATALGIWLVGNIGREKGSIRWPLLGCYLTTPFHIMGYTSYLWTTVLGIIAFLYKAKQWKRTVREQLPLGKRLLILLLCGSLYASLWGSYLYFNCRIVTKDGDRVKLRDAARNFLKSPAVQEFARNLNNLWHHALAHGFWSTMQQLIESLDPLGEKHALRVLELERGASQEDIRSRYRELTKKYHPDMIKDKEAKEEAQAKFVEIQQAYETLSQIKKRRKSRNTYYSSSDAEERTTF